MSLVSVEALQSESIFIPLGSERLHLKRYYTNPDGEAIFLMHGSLEDGRIFYSKSHKGLAPFLAKAGYDVFIGDLRGIGLSTPALSRQSTYGQTEAITEDIAAFVRYIDDLKGGQAQHWMAHSWGGVLLLSYFARYQPNVRSIVFFSSKRSIKVFNWQRLANIDFAWTVVFRSLIRIFGFVPVRKYNIGSADMARNMYYQMTKWVYSNQWIDDKDGYDYGAALKAANTPPTLYLTGLDETHLGHPDDVKRMMKEAGNNSGDQFVLLSKANGFMHDYGHIDILTHKDAPTDHFQLVLNWIREERKKN